MAANDDPQQVMTSERLRQAIDESMLTHTGRSIGDLASQRVIDDLWPLIEAREAALVAVVKQVSASADGRMLMCMCGIVGPVMRQDTPTWMSIDEPVIHEPGCVFARARALVASAEAGEQGDGEQAAQGEG